MLEISWSELLILAIVTLVFVGPKELPVFLRTIGRYAGMLRRQANEFKGQFDAAMREAEMASMKEEMEKMQASVNAEVMGMDKAVKETEAALSQSPSFSAAAAQAVMFPQSAGGLVSPPAAAPVAAAETAAEPAIAAVETSVPKSVPMGLVYERPEPVAVPQPAPAAGMAHEAKAEPEPPRPQAVKSES
jgi:sec-independent protein translocase protein TatB